MKRIVVLAILATLMACGGGFEAEHQKMVEEYEIQKANIQKAQEEYASRLQDYQQARQNHEQRAGETDDSLHTAINQMRALKEKLFPGNGLQERYDNFMGFYLKYGRGFFEVLKENLDPMESTFTVVVDR